MPSPVTLTLLASTAASSTMALFQPPHFSHASLEVRDGGLASVDKPLADPWAGSGCNCSSFCDNSCAINATVPKNITVYRMTPFGVTTLAEKNSADVAGDVSFVISRRAMAYECKVNPSSYGCNTMVQFQGDDPNSTDLVLEMQVEIDGQWGPYLYCNDVNTSDPLGAWKCTTSLDNSAAVPDYPKQCKDTNYSPYVGACFKGVAAVKKVVSGYGDCCSLASEHNAKGWTLNFNTMECSVYTLILGYGKCDNTTAGFYDPPRNECNCTRVFETVGRENITQAFGSHNRAYHVAGGLWLSHPANGECKDGHVVGDGSGCTWRHVETTRAINASCMYDRIDTAIEAKYPSCFSKCPPNNRSTDCYNECYTESSLLMSQSELVAPWNAAFGAAAGACPQVTI